MSTHESWNCAATRPWASKTTTPTLTGADPAADGRRGLPRQRRTLRRNFPELRVLTGVEYGQPHLDEARARQVIDLDTLDRVNGSLDTIPISDELGSVRSEPYTLYRVWPADKIIRQNLAEVPRMLAGSSFHRLLSHRVRGQAMRAVAGSGRALKLDIGGLIRPWIPQWWRKEGGRTLTIASDAHTPDWLAGNFYETMAMASHFGFRPGRQPEEFWTR